MLCVACTDETPHAPCIACGEDPLLDGRYRLEHLLGRGASGVTWAATRLDDGELVAVKAVSFPPGLSDKERELVAREVDVLRQLEHPDIPALLDALQVRRGGGIRVQYLVQTFLAGRTLAEELAERRFTEADVREVMAKVLPVLAYLHDLSPPVVHRDLKPANLMRRADGRIALIDFGSVKAALSDPDFGGSTVSGTFGYMAPEQFRGDADPRSDLYGLGAVAVALLTREDPRTLLDHAGRLQWHARAAVTPELTAWLDDLLQAHPDRRPASAHEALRRLTTLASPEPHVPIPPPASPKPVPPPASSDEAAPVLTAPPTAGASLVVALIIGIVGVGAAVFTVNGPGRAAVDPHRPPEPVACSDGPCRAPADFALRGLTLGQTVEAATAGLPELSDAQDIGPETIRPPIDALDVAGILRFAGTAVALPGRRLEVDTLVAEVPMTCTLAFAVDDGLSELLCEGQGFASASAWTSDATGLVAALTSRHGSPTRGQLSDQGFATNGRWSWHGRDATIGVEGSFSDLVGIQTGVLSLTVRTTAHQQAVAAAEAQAARAAEERRREEEARQDAEREALRERVGGNGGL